MLNLHTEVTECANQNPCRSEEDLPAVHWEEGKARTLNDSGTQRTDSSLEMQFGFPEPFNNFLCYTVSDSSNGTIWEVLLFDSD